MSFAVPFAGGGLGMRSAVTGSVSRLVNRLAAVNVDSFSVQSCLQGWHCGHPLLGSCQLQFTAVWVWV